MAKESSEQSAGSDQLPFFCRKPENKSIFPTYVHPRELDTLRRDMRVKTIYGFQMYVDAYDATVSKSIANTGTWEPAMIEVMARIVKQGDRVLNVGSQTGLEAIVMGKIIGPTGKLFILQPYSFSYQLLVKNIQLNGLENISQTYQIGASDKAGTGRIQVKFGNTGASEIRQRLQPKTQSETKKISTQKQMVNNRIKLNKFNHLLKQIEEVSLTTIDSLLPEHISLDFALIDAQKMQVSVLNGMKEVILRSPNLIIMVEWQYGMNSHANQNITQELLKFLLDCGYRMWRYVVPSGGRLCEKGRFVEYKRVETLLRVQIAQVFMFPRTRNALDYSSHR